MKRPPRQPAAFDLDDVTVEDDDPALDPFLAEESQAIAVTEGRAILAASRRRPRFLRWFFVAIGGLLTLAIGLAIDNLIRTLFERTDWLGWLGIGLVAVAGIGLVAFSIREIVGLVRLRRVGHIRVAAAEAVDTDSRPAARDVSGELIDLYARRPETARGRTALSGHLREIIDGRDLIGLAETELLAPLDAEAKRLVMAAARRVSLVTAISPRALVDVLFVFAQILRLIRQLATLYGGRPGMIGFLRLTRRVVGHLAITGGMGAGESLFQQVLGHGVAARISTRLGEGVINGILTARVGIAAIDVVRPLPFVHARPPRLGDIVTELTRRRERDATPEEASDNPRQSHGND